MYLSHWLTLTHQHSPTHTHTPAHTLHTWMHTGMRGEWHNPPNAKTLWAWSALCSTAALMNGHSDTRTKLRLDLYYTLGSKVTQSTDRSRNQRWMPLSLFNAESLRRRDSLTPKYTLELKKKTHLCYLSPLHGSFTNAGLCFVGHTRVIEQEEWVSKTEIIKVH